MTRCISLLPVFKIFARKTTARIWQKYSHVPSPKWHLILDDILLQHLLPSCLKGLPSWIQGCIWWQGSICKAHTFYQSCVCNAIDWTFNFLYKWTELETHKQLPSRLQLPGNRFICWKILYRSTNEALTFPRSATRFSCTKSHLAICAVNFSS